MSQLLSQNFTFCSQTLRHDSHCCLHASEPTLLGHVTQFGQSERQLKFVRLQVSRHWLFSPPQSRFGRGGGSYAGAGGGVYDEYPPPPPPPPDGFFFASFEVPVPVSDMSAVGGTTVDVALPP